MDISVPSPNSLHLTRLTLSEFRNYCGLRLDTGGSSVVATGPNGAGKTNLLEAISLLAPGRGLRGAAFEELQRQGAANGWAVAGEVEGPGGGVALGTAWSPEAPDGEGTNGSSRQVRIAGQAQKSSGALGGHMRLLWLTPAMDRLFSGSSSDRRRFLDRLVMAFDPEHGTRVAAFEKIIRERNRLLADPVPEAAWLSGIEEQAAETGVAIAAARVAAGEALKGLIRSTPAANGGSAFPWAEIEIEGALEEQLQASPAVQVEDEYRKMLRDSRALDQRAGRTLKGPHRSDFAVSHGPKGVAAKQCSTGEQKALLIGIVLAHARAVRAEFDGWAPVLLLDEVAAHLDSARREGLFEELDELGCQAWLTGTDETLFQPLRGCAQFLRVNEGRVAA